MAQKPLIIYPFSEARKLQFESLVKDRKYNNIILTVPSSAKESICGLIRTEFDSPGVVLVISPYIKRINDEIEYLQNMDISAITITSETIIPEREHIYASFSHKFFYATPEMIKKGYQEVKSFIHRILRSENCTVVFEEADMILFTFRTDFGHLPNVRESFSNTQWIALTDGNIENIASALSMENYETVTMG
ncbi:recQ-like DNA helicase blm-1 [Chironomus tepperi]|uniref:recQ-like DNA helicase blm-1 n=1 Tax=Chironomus tepperi TaxID=113505 RepID=UPI00391F951D